MKAVVKAKDGCGNVELMDVPEPECGPGEVKIEVKAAGICTTDIHIFHGTFKCNTPVILGHEFSGAIVKVGEGVNGLSTGDRVAVLPSAAIICGKCEWCRSGYFCFCPTRRGMGHGTNGAFSKYCVVRKEVVFKLPASMDYISASFCEPLACCVQAVNDIGRVKSGDTVMVFGPGPIGLLILQLSVQSGAKTIVCGTSSDAERLTIARRLGAVTVDVQRQDPFSVIGEFTPCGSVNIVFECSGAHSAIEQSLNLLRPMGRHVQVGLTGKPVPLTVDAITKKQLEVLGSYGFNWNHWQKAMELIVSKEIDVDCLVSEQLPLSRWEEGFKKVEEKKGLKIILYPDE
jgi:L-iditol 2-dehydrogenase